ncbi:MAG TPA: type II toxin-antitoxin system VapC family toxin [Thermoanaerobaculia bacterium]|nr:type II toxin-antitoxin system VapC family toxin [Thermoanaerobaculia bacterium]
MRLLLDTHAFLWFIAGSPALTGHARQLIEKADNERFLSVASLWEMAIKISLGKLDIAQSLSDLVTSQVQGNAIQLLEISTRHRCGRRPALPPPGSLRSAPHRAEPHRGHAGDQP